MSSYTVELECSIEDSLRTLALSNGTSITNSDDDVLRDIVLF